VVESIQNTLERVRTGIEEAVQAAHEKIDVLKQGIPAVEHIVVYGVLPTSSSRTSHSRSKSTPGSRTTGLYIEVAWAPGWSVPELYNRIASKVIEAAGK
jgi:hypothetical protein